jgi:hypothetical protein
MAALQVIRSTLKVVEPSLQVSMALYCGALLHGSFRKAHSVAMEALRPPLIYLSGPCSTWRTS